MNLPVTQKHFLSLSRKLFLSTTSPFLVFTVCLMAYQYQWEKEYKVELLNIQLQDCNDLLCEKLYDYPQDMTPIITNHLRHNVLKDLRITVVNLGGEVLLDSRGQNTEQLGNHIGREEIQRALHSNIGSDVRHTSETTGVSYFYPATLHKNYIICLALPYSVSLINNLKVDPHYTRFAAIVTLLSIVIFHKFTNKPGTSINQLREFAMRADCNEPIEMAMQPVFPHNELGEISQHIIQMYRRLHKTKETLCIEREKLITHLQVPHEGLEIFSKNKKEIPVNNSFIQYSNLISDSDPRVAEGIFNISELKEITDFINKAPKRPVGKEEKRMSVTINRNGKTFVAECIIFQDVSLEISINGITQEEKQVHLKRQLTQDIIHKLKTPVNSIQGYLEAIVNNENIPKGRINIFLECCYVQSNCLGRLLCDTSVLARMNKVANIIDIGKVDISVLVTNIVNEVSLELGEKHITVVNSLKKEIQMRDNYLLLYSIFRNPMDSATAYAGNNIHIHVNCFCRDENFYYFSFVDTGIGVPPEYLNRLFERFYWVDKGRSRRLGGAGLDLVIAKNAVIIRGGSISAKNSRGGGLEFVFTLAKEK